MTVALADGRVSRARRSRRASRRKRWAASAYTLPGWLLLLAMFALPIGVGIYLSFRSDKIGSFVPGRNVGLNNYRREVGAGTFREALETTLIIAGLGIVIQVPAGLGLAAMLHRNLRGTRLFRSVLLLPMLLTPVAVGLMWRFMFDTDLGVINWLLETLHLSRINWLGDRPSAIIAVVLVDSWQSIPFVMLLCLAGLAGLPTSPIEAAQVEGASPFQIFRHVTMPLLRPVLLVVLLIRLIDVLKIFDIIFILTRGGPGRATQTVGILTYNTGFSFLETGRAASLGVALTVLTLPVYLLWSRATKRTR